MLSYPVKYVRHRKEKIEVTANGKFNNKRYFLLGGKHFDDCFFSLSFCSFSPLYHLSTFLHFISVTVFCGLIYDSALWWITDVAVWNILLHVEWKERLLCYHLSFSRRSCAWSCSSWGSLDVSKAVQKKSFFSWELQREVTVKTSCTQHKF